jgi:molecular chaperone GrpE
MRKHETPDAHDKPAQAGAAAEQPVAEKKDAAEELAAAKKQAADNLDRYLRASADLENFRRRAVREKEELRLFAVSGLLEDLLPALDNLALALAASKQQNADLKALAQGVELAQQQLKAALAAHGMTEVNPLGQPFDPHQHQAISHQASPDVKPEHVLTVVRSGYLLNGRLLRPASVIVSSGKPVGEPAA